MKSGTMIGAGMIGVSLVAGVALYVLQGFVYYHRADGLAQVEIGGQPFAVSDYRGLDNSVLPLRLRGCFRLADPQAALAVAPAEPDAEPFEAPFWFDCWDAAQLDADLTSGAAKAVLAETDQRGDFTFQRIVAIYPDGRAYQWRRLVEDKK